MVYERDDVEGLDSSILTHPNVLKYSGHEETFTDPLVDCKDCKSRWRSDHIEDGKCPSCGSSELTEPRPFNLMFKTSIGPVDDGSSYAYLRPETAQQIFTNFKNVLDSTNRAVPFGVAQMGKSFRNEITPGKFIFRVREFEQMELEFFVHPGDDEAWHKKWIENRVSAACCCRWRCGCFILVAFFLRLVRRLWRLVLGWLGCWQRLLRRLLSLMLLLRLLDIL
mgnify:CR=1 FL=1